MNRILPGISLLALSLVSTQAGVVNIDLNLGGTPTYSGLGAAPDAPGNTTWNGLAVTGGSAPGTATASSTYSGLVFSDNSPSGLGVTIRRTNQSDTPGGTQSSGNAAADLLRDYVVVNSGDPGTKLSGTITISGLAAGTTYDLYLYGAGSQTEQNTAFTIDGTTLQTAGPLGATSVLTESEDFILFTGVLPDASNQIAVTYANIIDDATPSQRAAVNGLQIVANQPEARPRLAIDLVGSSGVQLSWTTNDPDYRLEYAAVLPAPFWNSVTNAPFIVETNFAVTLPATELQRFFLLRKP